MKQFFTILVSFILGSNLFGQTLMNIYQCSDTVLHLPILCIDSNSYSTNPNVLNIYLCTGTALHLPTSCIDSITYSSQPTCGTITDIDGNVYTTVEIGTQCWMQQNLKTTRYTDGSAIGEVEDSAIWANIYNTGSQTPAWCYYDESAAGNATYGKLYNWYAVADPRNVCPTGWHVPSDSEYTVLDNYLGGSSVSGGHMKTITLWQSPNTGADNSSGFTTLPTGYRNYDGSFYDIGLYGYFWTSTAFNAANSRARYLYYADSNDSYVNSGNEHGFSVRCVGD